MAANNESITLNLQDFIPYPLKILQLSDLLGTGNRSNNRSSSQSASAARSSATRNKGGNACSSETNSSDECPFDCCQKKLQQVYFPDCELTNATIKMNIGSGVGDLLGGKGGVFGVGGIPCLERRTIYEGRVTDMPVKFEELLKESGAAQGEDIVVDRNSTAASSLALGDLHAQHAQQQQQLSLRNNAAALQNAQNNNSQLGKDSTLRLTFHQQQQNQYQVAYSRALAAAANANANANSYVGIGGAGIKETRISGRQQSVGVGINNPNANLNNNVGEDAYHYVWDSRKSGWTWTKANNNMNSSPGAAQERYISNNASMPYTSLSQQQQQQLSAGNIGRPTGGHQFDGWNSQQQQQQQLQLHLQQQQQQQLHPYGDEPPGGSPAGGNEYWDKRDVEHMHSLWLKQQQLHSQPQHRFRKPASSTGTSNSPGSSLLEYNNIADQSPSSGPPTNRRITDGNLHLMNPNNLNIDAHVDQQLNSYLKSYKYMNKPNLQSGYGGMHIGGSITRGSPMMHGNNNKQTLGGNNLAYPIGNHTTKTAQAARTRGNLANNLPLNHPQQDTPLHLKRPISPRSALEQFERLEKYWNYQHQLLEAEDFSHHSGDSNNRQLQQTQSAAAASSYGGQTPAKLLRTGTATQQATPSQHELDIRAYAGLGSSSSSGGGIHSGASLAQTHAQSYGGTPQGASSSATWGSSVYGGRNHFGNSTQPATATSGALTGGNPPGSSGTTTSSSSTGTTECNWAVSVIEILPQSFPPDKQSIAGTSNQHQGANTTVVSKERLLNLSRSAAAAAANNPSGSLLAGSKTRDMCKAITSADVSNLYCTTINRVPARDLSLKTTASCEVATKVLDSFEYNKAVLIGPISNNESEDKMEMSASKSSVLELSKLAKNHERQKQLLEMRQMEAEALLLSKKTNTTNLDTITICEDNNVPRDLSIPRRSRSDDGILLRNNNKEPGGVDNNIRVPGMPQDETALMFRKETLHLADEVSRRHSDDPVTMSRTIEGALFLAAADMPERSKSTPGSNHDTVYDHIVLLDKRVKTYMCKRCLETLKSEQEIRNHLFCKMLNNTIQCHVCRHLFNSEEYPEHLKLHAVNAKQ